MSPTIRQGRVDACSQAPARLRAEQALKLADAADAQGVRTAIGLQTRFSPAVARALEVITAGGIGRVNSITTHITRAKASGATLPGWMAYTLDPSAGAGPLEIHGGHTLDVVRFLAGPLTLRPAVTALANPRYTIAETGDVIEATNLDQYVISGTSAEGATVSVSVHHGVAAPSRARIPRSMAVFALSWVKPTLMTCPATSLASPCRFDWYPKLPERVGIIAELPLSNVGKVAKKALREDVEQRITAEHRR